MTKRLKIVVPYRDRQEHLDHFLPYMQDYMDDSGIPYHIVIAEQAPGLAFNRGAMKNLGFLLGEPSDYTCFHDVDYLPLAADYSWTDAPSCLVLKGANDLPVRIGAPSQAIRLDMTNFFGAVVMIPNKLFRQVDGYSNDYWGWGYEDTDLLKRFDAAGISCFRRPGSFSPLLHDSHGYETDGSLNEEAGFNRAIFLRKWKDGKPKKEDGLSTIAYEILSRETVAGSDGESGTVERIKVQLFLPSG